LSEETLPCQIWPQALVRRDTPLSDLTAGPCQKRHSLVRIDRRPLSEETLPCQNWPQGLVKRDTLLSELTVTLVITHTPITELTIGLVQRDTPLSDLTMGFVKIDTPVSDLTLALVKTDTPLSDLTLALVKTDTAMSDLTVGLVRFAHLLVRVAPFLCQNAFLIRFRTRNPRAEHRRQHSDTRICIVQTGFPVWPQHHMQGEAHTRTTSCSPTVF